MKGEIPEMPRREINRIRTLNTGMRKRQRSQITCSLLSEMLIRCLTVPKTGDSGSIAERYMWKGKAMGSNLESLHVSYLRETCKHYLPNKQLMDLNLNQGLVGDTDLRVICIQGTVKILRVYKKSKDHMSRQRKPGILRNLALKRQRKQRKKQKRQTENESSVTETRAGENVQERCKIICAIKPSDRNRI